MSISTQQKRKSVSNHQTHHWLDRLPFWRQREAVPRVQETNRFRVALVGYNWRGFVRFPLKPPTWPQMSTRIKSLPGHIAGEYSQHTDGFSKALDMAKHRPRGWNARIVWFTDGQLNPPNQHPLIDALAREAARCGIRVTTVAITDAADQPILRQVAERTGGRHLAGLHPAELTRQLKRLYSANGTPECVVLLVDCSGSMILGHMNGKRRIDVVVDVLLHSLP